MGIVRIDQLEPGMVLIADVVDRNERVLLNAGTTLTEKNIRVFRMWGVTEADIQGVATAEPEAAEPEDQTEEEAAEHVRELFARSNRDHPAMAELMRLATAWHVRMIKAKKGHGTEAA